jgi:hypothetical protein
MIGRKPTSLAASTTKFTKGGAHPMIGIPETVGVIPMTCDTGEFHVCVRQLRSQFFDQPCYTRVQASLSDFR